MDDSTIIDATAIVSLAHVRLQAKSRLLRTACCPDKDLVVLFSATASERKMSLWKIQGSKKWEVSLGSVGTGAEQDEVSALAWSPDGQYIAVAHFPPRITLYSLHSGRALYPLPPEPGSRITGLWWFKKERKTNKRDLPDMLRRGNVVPGSALSIMRSQPLLDPTQDYSAPLNATDLFAFQGTQSKRELDQLFPEFVINWPSLPPDPIAASMKAPPTRSSGADMHTGEQALDEKDLSNMDSLLIATMDNGDIQCFLDGTYPLGTIGLGAGREAVDVMKDTTGDTLLVHAAFRAQTPPGSSPTAAVLHTVRPLRVALPLLYVKSTRHIAESSTAARALASYTIVVVKEMRRAWFGAHGQSNGSGGGAREFGASYIRGLQRWQTRFNQQVNPIFDLTVLLTTGRPSSALSDFNQTGDLTSERGLAKWEITVAEALLKIRDYSEKRIAPACQRLHLILEEVKGWSLLPHLYGSYGFSTDAVSECLELAGMGVFLAAWLAAAARTELNRFVEFMHFLRYETSRYNPSSGRDPVVPAQLPRHDVLQVDAYLQSGLAKSSIERFFAGPLPRFSPDALAVPHVESLHDAVETMRAAVKDPSAITWPPVTKKKDLSHLDRNLEALVETLAEKCRLIFTGAAGAVGRTAAQGLAQSQSDWDAAVAVAVAGQMTTATGAGDYRVAGTLSRLRVTFDAQTGSRTEYRAVRVEADAHGLPGRGDLLCVGRATYGSEHAEAGWPGTEADAVVGLAFVECVSVSRREGGDEEEADADAGERVRVFDMEFFDEESLVIVYQNYAHEGTEAIGTLDYRALEYRNTNTNTSAVVWQEELIAEAIRQVAAGQAACGRVKIGKRRGLQLRAGEGGQMSLAVNGRAGRRVGCVLDGAGTGLEMFDMEGEPESDE